jgi:peptide/nickel transport system permease protein
MSRSTRLAGYLVVLWLGATANFLLPRLLPGDPVQFLIGEEASRLTAAQRTAVLAQFGLDAPLSRQYVRYWSGLARLDLGTSVSRGEPVLRLVAERLPWTLLLVGSAIVLSFLIGFALAGWFHWVRSARTAAALMSTVLFFGSLPSFWVGMVFIAVFAVTLGWLPSHGVMTPGAPLAWRGVLRHAVLPVAALTLGYLPSVFLVARAALQEALGEGLRGARALARREADPRAVSPGRTDRPPAADQSVRRQLRRPARRHGRRRDRLRLARPRLAAVRRHPLARLSAGAGVFLLLVFSVVLANFAADIVQRRLDPRLRRTPEAA